MLLGKVEEQLSPKLSDQTKEQRVLQILEAAKRVFADKGYGAVSLKDIIEETGMSRGWIYLYYQSKDEIFEDLLNYQDEQYERELAERLEQCASVWELVYELQFQQLQELLVSHKGDLMPAFYEYFLLGYRNEERQELLRQRYEKGIARFAAILQAGVDRGQFSPIMSVIDISRIVASFQEGIITHAITVGIETANTKIQLESFIDYVKSLLRPITS